jgi:hypothetical protein
MLYEKLSESEPRCNPNAAMETLKAILALGYRLEFSECGQEFSGGSSVARGMLGR